MLFIFSINSRYRFDLHRRALNTKWSWFCIKFMIDSTRMRCICYKYRWFGTHWSCCISRFSKMRKPRTSHKASHKKSVSNLLKFGSARNQFSFKLIAWQPNDTLEAHWPVIFTECQPFSNWMYPLNNLNVHHYPTESTPE